MNIASDKPSLSFLLFPFRTNYLTVQASALERVAWKVNEPKKFLTWHFKSFHWCLFSVIPKVDWEHINIMCVNNNNNKAITIILHPNTRQIKHSTECVVPSSCSDSSDLWWLMSLCSDYSSAYQNYSAFYCFCRGTNNKDDCIQMQIIVNQCETNEMQTLCTYTYRHVNINGNLVGET